MAGVKKLKDVKTSGEDNETTDLFLATADCQENISNVLPKKDKHMDRFLE